MSSTVTSSNRNFALLDACSAKSPLVTTATPEAVAVDAAVSTVTSTRCDSGLLPPGREGGVGDILTASRRTHGS